MSFKLLGITVHPMTIYELNSLISYKIENKVKCIICSQNLHGVYVYHNDRKMKTLHNNSFTRIDGMSLIFMGKLLGLPIDRQHRVTWVDWFHPLLEYAQKKNWRIFYLGSKQEIAQKGIYILKERYPTLKIDYAHGYFNQKIASKENMERLESIRVFNPDILIVGMGMPKQEHWILDNLENIEAKVVLTSGAAMEYVAGAVSTPPRWMGKVGLEWMYRLFENPRRFWKRYLVEPWFILGVFLNDLFYVYILRRDLKVPE